MSSYNPHRKGQKDTLAWPFIQAAIKQGFGELLKVRELESAQQADRLRKALYNGARHHNTSTDVKVFHGGEPIDRLSLQAIAAGKAEDPYPDEPYEVHFRVFRKDDGRVHTFQTVGGDRSKLAYNPYARKIPPTIEQIQGL